MNSKGKTEAKKFLEKYNLWDITSQNLKRICDDMGYTVVEFNHIYNDENVKILLEALNIKKYAESSKGFTYADKNYRLIFLHDGLSEEEKTVVLSHEIGHVCCGHFNTAPILGKDVFEEYEANEFSHYILSIKSLPHFLPRLLSLQVLHTELFRLQNGKKATTVNFMLLRREKVITKKNVFL